MTKIQQVESLLSDLTPEERAQLIRSILAKWSGSPLGITRLPGVNGGDACIVRTRIPVWLLEQLRRQGASDAELIKAYPQLHADDLNNAWAYVLAHPDEIERQIAEHEAA